MPTDSKLPNLVLFLRSVIPPTQIGQLIELLKEGVSTPETLDPELTPKKANVPKAIQLPEGIEQVLKEIEDTYPIDKFPNPSQEDSRRVRDSYPNFIENLSAFQIRHLLKRLKEKLNI